MATRDSFPASVASKPSQPAVRHDLWFALRRIRLRPLHSAVVICTLGLGIGAALAVFAIVDAVLVRPLPYPEASQLVRVTRKLPVAGLPEVPFADRTFDAALPDMTLFKALPAPLIAAVPSSVRFSMAA